LILTNYKIFGLLTAEHVMALLFLALALREPLQAAMPNQRLRADVTETLDWMGEVVAAGQLPETMIKRLKKAHHRAVQDALWHGYSTDSGYQLLIPPPDPGSRRSRADTSSTKSYLVGASG
jgi:hypothetical protein